MTKAEHSYRFMEAGDGIVVQEADWTFGGDTPKTFNEHVRRSVPYYEDGHEIITGLSDYFVHKDSICYEIGSSTGVLSGKLAARHPEPRWIGLDIVPEMVEEARRSFKEVDNLSFETQDGLEYSFVQSDFIVSYYTLQFVLPRERQTLINRIYQSLNWGGALIVFEKVRAPDARFQDIATGMYLDYKLKQDYSPKEIIAKSKSLKGKLEPFSTLDTVPVGVGSIMDEFSEVSNSTRVDAAKNS